MRHSALKKRKLTIATPLRPQRRNRKHSMDTIMATQFDNNESTSTSAPPQEEPSLYHLSPQQRQQFYRHFFGRNVEPLTIITEPQECQQWPELSDEIIEAYLHYTTFTIKVWTNYDAAAKKFYIDEQRTQDCGKLVLKPSQEERLARADPGGDLSLSRIHLEIGTPFKTLCTVKLQAVRSEVEHGFDIRAKMGYFDTDHPRVVDYVTNICNQLDTYDLIAGQSGFLLVDLRDIAGMFCRKPDRAALVKLQRTPNVGPFMDFFNEDSDNPGFLDLKALDKGCKSGCQACDANQGSRYWGGGGLTTSRWFHLR